MLSLFYYYIPLTIYIIIQFQSAQIKSQDVDNNDNLSSDTRTKTNPEIICNESNARTRVSRPCMCGFLRDREEPNKSARMISSSKVTCTGGFARNYPCKNVDLLSYVPLIDLNMGRNYDDANDIWGWTHPDTKKEYAIIGVKSGTVFVDITDPVNPEVIGKLRLRRGASSYWGDVKTYGNYAFIVAESYNQGMQIFDLTTLDQVKPGSTLEETAYYNGFGNAHNIAINEKTGFAYAVGSNSCNAGLHIVDIRNPTNPTQAGCFSRDGYVHDAHCVTYEGPDAAYVGKEICFTSNEDTVNIIDVTNKGNPTEISRTSYNYVRYTHQGWLTEDHRYLFIGDELDESSFGSQTATYVINVENLNNPYLAGEHFGPTFATDHNLYVKEDHVYQANYRAGLRILQMKDLSKGKLEEVGYFDIHPGLDSSSMNGAWSVYPYFESGNIIVSGIEQGLFVLRYKVSRTNPTEAPSTKPPSPASKCWQYRNEKLCKGDLTGCCAWHRNKKGKKSRCKVKTTCTTESICNEAGSKKVLCKRISKCCFMKAGKCSHKISKSKCALRTK